jgi:hypothetical protein
VFDYTALITLIAYVALMFVPLYIPIAVSIIGGIRRRRENSGRQALRQPAMRAAEFGSPRPSASVATPPTAAAMLPASDGVLPDVAWPAVEPA